MARISQRHKCLTGDQLCRGDLTAHIPTEHACSVPGNYRNPWVLCARTCVGLRMPCIKFLEVSVSLVSRFWGLPGASLRIYRGLKSAQS